MLQNASNDNMLFTSWLRFLFFHNSSIPQSFYYLDKRLCFTTIITTATYFCFPSEGAHFRLSALSRMNAILCFALFFFFFSYQPFSMTVANCTDSETRCSQFAGWGLMLLKTNKAWGACGVKRGSPFKGRSESTSAFVWKKECQECGLFQETSMQLNSARVDHHNLTSTRWLMRNQHFLNLLMSNGGTSICWQASGNFHLRRTVHSATGCYNLWLRAGGTWSADYSPPPACSSDSVKVSLLLN